MKSTGTGRQYPLGPGVIGILEFPDAEAPETYSWSLRIFNDFTAFKQHFPVPSKVPAFAFLTVVPSYGGPFPLGYSFTAKEQMDKAISSNPGNKQYSQSGELIGPVPKFE